MWGNYACFSHPELKVDRVSYEVITPSAARGVLEAVLWKPAIRYVIDEIAVCSPIRLENTRRNIVLRDVRYVITAHFKMTDKAGESDNEGKFADMLRRRLRNGNFFQKPYFGIREFPANIRLLEDEEQPPTPINETRSLGLMLYDVDYIKHMEKVKGKDETGKKAEVEVEITDECNPAYFMAELRGGVIDLRKVEVLR
jgi:CRISPR-associated protein Cas5d